MTKKNTWILIDDEDKNRKINCIFRLNETSVHAFGNLVRNVNRSSDAIQLIWNAIGLQVNTKSSNVQMFQHN